jgi:hypothetical protein
LAQASLPLVGPRERGPTSPPRPAPQLRASPAPSLPPRGPLRASPANARPAHASTRPAAPPSPVAPSLCRGPAATRPARAWSARRRRFSWARASGSALHCTSSPKWLCAVFSPTTPPKSNRPGFFAQFLAHRRLPSSRPRRGPPSEPSRLRRSRPAGDIAVAEVSSSSLSSLYRSPPRRSLDATGARLSRPGRPRLSSSGRSARPAALTPSAIAAASRFAGEPRPCTPRPSRCALAACLARPHASGRWCAASTAEPSPNQRAAACPAPRARSAVATVASNGDRTAEPNPAGVPAARPVRSSTIAAPWARC